MLEIMDNLELPMASRSGKGNRFFTAEVSATMEILEVGQGFIIPWHDKSEDGKKLMRRSIVFFGNKLAEKHGSTFAYGNLDNGIGIKCLTKLKVETPATEENADENAE